MRAATRAGAILLAVGLATSGAAQDRMTPENCVAVWNQFTDLTGLTVETESNQADEEGWCLVEGIVVDIAPAQVWRLQSLRWRAGDIDRFIADGLPPRALEVEGTDMQVVPVTGDPVFDYLFQVQTAKTGTAFGGAVRWDGVRNAVNVDGAYFQFDATNRVEANAVIDGLNLTDIASLQTSLGQMGLSTLTMTAQFDGWFEHTLALPLGMALLEQDGGVPQAQVIALKERTIEILQGVSEDSLPEVSRSALADFVASLPHPRGALRLDLTADPVIGAARVVPLMTLDEPATPEAILGSLVQGVRLLFTWQPTGGGQ